MLNYKISSDTKQMAKKKVFTGSLKASATQAAAGAKKYVAEVFRPPYQKKTFKPPASQA